jgi:hypothetical protein
MLATSARFQMFSRNRLLAVALLGLRPAQGFVRKNMFVFRRFISCHVA